MPRNRDGGRAEDMITASIIIPNTNSRQIDTILHALHQQRGDLSTVEVLVVGTDTPGLVREDSLVRFLPTCPGAHASDKRNLGMQQARGQIFLFLDDDCIPWQDWLSQHLRRHRENAMVVGGAITFRQQPYIQLANNVSAFHGWLPFSPPEKLHLCSANLSVQRQVIEQVGYMPAARNRAEDVEWTLRFRAAGYRLHFEPCAVIWHNPPLTTLPQLWRRWFNDAPQTLAVMLRYAPLLRLSRLIQQRWLFLWAAPLISLWATAYTFKQPRIRALYWHTLPLVYLTKLAWCLGAFWHFPQNWQHPTPPPALLP